LKNKNEVHFCCNHGIGLGISKTHFTFVFVFGAVRTGYRPNKNKKRGIFHFCFCFLCPVSIGLSDLEKKGLANLFCEAVSKEN
jgi:hypothetical protein